MSKLAKFLLSLNFLAFTLVWSLILGSQKPTNKINTPQAFAAATCNKIGINTAVKFTEDGGVLYNEPPYVLALYTGPESEAKIIAAINSSSSTIMVRLGAGLASRGPDATTYALSLNNIAGATGKPFIATAGHNEANCAEFFPLATEKTYIQTIISSVTNPNITLISGQLDYYCDWVKAGVPEPTGYIDDIASIAGLDGIALPFYTGVAGDTQTTINLFDSIASRISLPIYITESGPYNNTMEAFANAIGHVQNHQKVQAVLLFNGFYLNPEFSYARPFSELECRQAFYNSCNDPQTIIEACGITESDCSADNCKDCTIDPNDPFSTGILMCPLEVPPGIIFDQYQSTCNTEQVNITSNGNTEICTSNGVCVGRGNVTIEEIPDQVHVFLDQGSTSRANTTQDATGRVANNDTSNSLNTAPIYKLNPNSSNFRQIKNYLTAMSSCQSNYDQPGCFPPKYILPSDIAEDDFVGCIGGIGGLTEDNYRTRLNRNGSCSTKDGSQISVNFLEVWSNIDYNILGCLPAFRVEYTNAPPPDQGVWGWFNALIGVNSDQPALSIKEYKTCNASITPFSFGQVESSVANLGSHLLPQQMVTQINNESTSRTTSESFDAYLNGPLIMNLQNLGDNTNTTKTIAAKINRDNPSCNVDPNTDSSTLIKHDAEAKAAEAISERDSTPPSNPLSFLFEINLNPLSSTQPPQTATYLSADITYAGTTEQSFSNNIYRAFIPKEIVNQDNRDDLKVEHTEIENLKDVDSETVTAQTTIPNPDRNLPPTTETASWNATTPNNAPPSRAHLSITNPFASLKSITAPAAFNIPRCVIKSFGGAFRGESISNCVSGITRRPTPNNVCAFSGGPTITSNSLKVVIAKAAAKHNVPVQLLLAMIQGENCRFTSGPRNICNQTDEFLSTGNYLDPGVEYPHSTKCENPGTGTDTAFDSSYKGIVSIFEFAHSAGGWGEARDPQYTNVCSINDGIYGIARVLANYKQAATGSAATSQNWSRNDMEKTIVNWVTGRGGINGCATNDADLPRDGDGVWNQEVRDTAVGAIGIFCKYIEEYYDPTSNLYVNSTCR